MLMPGEGMGDARKQTAEEVNSVANEWMQMGEEMQKAQQDATAGEQRKSGGPVELWDAEVVDSAGNVLGKTKAGVAGKDYYVVDEGVPITPEMGDDTKEAKPQMRMYVDPGLGSAVIKQVQIEEVEVPGEEPVAQEATETSWETVEKEADKREGLDSWLRSVEGTPEEYWQKLAEERSERGVELGEMPDTKKIDEAIAGFFENGLVGVEGEARAVREEMARKAVLKDIAGLMEKNGGELNEEAMRGVCYDAQRRLEEIYRGNRELREGARDEKMSADEEIAWHLAMEPRGARLNPLLVMQQHTRRPGETSDEYEKRLRDYAEDTLEHQKRLEDDKEYNAANPTEAAGYATRVMRNAQRDDLPEYTYQKWEEATDAGEQAETREGKVKRLFERVREKIGFRKAVDKVMKKVAGAIVGVVDWANEVLAEEDGGDGGGVDVIAEKPEDAEREQKLQDLRAAKGEAERRMSNSQGDNDAVLGWAQVIMRLNAKIGEIEAESERVAEAVAA